MRPTLWLRIAACSTVAILGSACGSDEPTFCIDDTQCVVGTRCVNAQCLPSAEADAVADASTDASQDIATPDVAVSDVPDEDGLTPEACEPSCESLRRGACVDGACGACFDGFTPASSASTAACCAPGERPTADGLGCEVPPECVGVACENGGVCTVVAGLGICDCPPGTDGSRCEVACASEPIVPTYCGVLVDGEPSCLGWFVDGEATWSGGDCTREPEICTTEGEGCENGCVSFYIAVDLGEEMAVDRVDWRADWWSKRPEDVRVRVGDVVDEGIAFRAVAELRGNVAPWQCVTGAACTEEVPDECCPDGRGAPQRINEGALLSLWDVHRLPSAVRGQVLALEVVNSYTRDSVILQGMRWFGSTCVGGLACDPSVEDCGSPCGPGEAWDGAGCAEMDGCAGDPCFDGVACADVPAPGTGFECGSCPEGFSGDGVDCTPVECTPSCPDWQQCVRGSCAPRPCSMGCGGGTCFEGTCLASGVCEDECTARYGRRVWRCDGSGYCAVRECGTGRDCGGGVDCVSDPGNNTRGPGGVGVFDQTCQDGGSSPCGGVCDGLCSASSGRCAG